MSSRHYTSLYKKYGSVDKLLFSQLDYMNISSSLSVAAIQLMLSNKALEWLYGLFIIAHTEKNFFVTPDFLKYTETDDIRRISFFPEVFKVLEDTDADDGANRELISNVKKYAERGNIEAMLHFAWCLERGKGIHKNKEEAHLWYEKAAFGGSARAQYHLGITSDNKRDSINWLKLSAEHNNKAALRRLGEYYYMGQNLERDFKKAFRCFEKIKELGGEADYLLGYLFFNGQGVTKNYLTAISLFSKVRKPHIEYAILCMGYCYEKGYGVQQNYNNAFKSYSIVKEKFTEVLVRLGVFYSRGCGVEQNGKIAYEYFYKAYNEYKNDRVSQLCIGICYAKGWGVTTDYNKALEWYDYMHVNDNIIIDKHEIDCLLDSKTFSEWEKEALAENVISQRNIGHCYFYGIGVSRDDDRAAEWYEKAARNGDSESLIFLWLSRLTNENYNNIDAIKLLSKAVNQNNPEGKSLLADFYLGGWDVPFDEKRAVQLYFDAAASGEMKAMCDLGYCYGYGKGVEKDVEKAADWYLKFVELTNEISIKWLTARPMTIY